MSCNDKYRANKLDKFKFVASLSIIVYIRHKKIRLLAIETSNIECKDYLLKTSETAAFFVETDVAVDFYNKVFLCARASIASCSA